MKIFISYRRDDTSGHVGRLTDRLTARFGRDAVFRDLDSISPGKDFTDAINMAIESSDAVLVVIGRNWLTAERPDGSRRLDDPGDFVRIEIAAALERQVQVVPVLVDRARMPSPESLPEVLVPFARRNALELSESRWDYDVGRLIDVLDPSSPETVTGSMPTAVAPYRKRPRLLAALGIVVFAALAAVVFVPRGGGHKALANSSRDTTTTSTTAAPPSDPVAVAAPGESRPATATGGAGATPGGARPQGQASQAPSAAPQPSANHPTATPVPQTPTPTPATPPSLPAPGSDQTADAVAGNWSGTTAQGFQVALGVRSGCGIGELCGSISVSGEYYCKGNFTLYNVSGGTYEFNVDNFSSDSSSSCYPGAGEYLTPAGGNALTYTTSYGPSGTLFRS